MASPSEIIAAIPEEVQAAIDSFMVRRERSAQEERIRQISEALAALDELKARNEANPTAKRTKMIQSLEERYRKNGILR